MLSLRPGLGLEDPQGHLMKVLALDDKVLALALAPPVLALALREKSWPWHWQGQGQDCFSQTQATCLLYVYALLTHHGVTRQSAISCFGMHQRLACELDVGCKIVRVSEVRAAI